MIPAEKDFIQKLTLAVEEHISDEQFGVSELAGLMGMSRSNLLRKTKKLTDLSVSQFIRKVRLDRAMEMLKTTDFNVSEVSYKVGFGSTSYFIKCFGDQFGFPPGNVGKQDLEEVTEIPAQPSRRRKNRFLYWSTGLVLLILSGILIYTLSFKSKPAEKSIAVLPFKNDSDDSTNVYFINGVMESILNDLQKIEGLKVISRTSVEKYRHSNKTIPEIAKELHVKYFVEGSGQTNGNQILLHVQLIDGTSDDHVWSEQYQKELKDVFALQNNVARMIANKIQITLTPKEIKRINEIPTKNLEAYDNFLKGRELFNKTDPKSMGEAIGYFKKAVALDDTFALAYADISIAYYILDIFQYQKTHIKQINEYADKALLYNSELAQSLVAKAFSFMVIGKNQEALPYLEKALQYNPNSTLVLNILSEYYTNYMPDINKYLEYALKGIQLDIASHDSATMSNIYLHISNAFIQAGFTKEAENYIDKSLLYNPQNLYSQYVRAYVLYAKNENLNQLKDLLVETLKNDTTRLDVLQEVGKAYYYLRDYKKSYQYYSRFLKIRDSLKLDIFVYEDAKIGLVLDKMGMKQQSEKLFKAYKAYADQDRSIYKNLSLATYYSYQNDVQKALEHLKLFSKTDNYHYWTLLFLDKDPLLDNVRKHSEYNNIFKKLKQKFWDNHQHLKNRLKQKGLI